MRFFGARFSSLNNSNRDYNLKVEMILIFVGIFMKMIKYLFDSAPLNMRREYFLTTKPGT
jgi:hypothetical protein